MSEEEKRKLILMVGGFGGLFLLIAVAVIALDLRSLVQSNKPQFEAALNDAVSNALPYQPVRFDENGEPILEDEFKLPREVRMMGQIERGQRVEGRIGMYRMEGWVLNGQAGESYHLDFDALEGGYYWQMEVYRPNRELLRLTADSDAGYADFSLLDVKLKEDGAYVVVLRAFGEDGAYALSLQ